MYIAVLCYYIPLATVPSSIHGRVLLYKNKP